MILLLVGCTPVIKLAYGIKNPERERSAERLVAYLERKQMRTDNVLRRAEVPRPYSVPEVHVFDRNGAFIPYGEPGSCNAAAFDFLETLDRTVTYDTTDAEDFEQLRRDRARRDGPTALISSRTRRHRG